MSFSMGTRILTRTATTGIRTVLGMSIVITDRSPSAEKRESAPRTTRWPAAIAPGSQAVRSSR
jgi:hypothetical protein